MKTFIIIMIATPWTLLLILGYAIVAAVRKQMKPPPPVEVHPSYTFNYDTEKDFKVVDADYIARIGKA